MEIKRKNTRNTVAVNTLYGTDGTVLFRIIGRDHGIETGDDLLTGGFCKPGVNDYNKIVTTDMADKGIRDHSGV